MRGLGEQWERAAGSGQWERSGGQPKSARGAKESRCVQALGAATFAGVWTGAGSGGLLVVLSESPKTTSEADLVAVAITS